MTVKEAEKIFSTINFNSVVHHFELEADEYPFCKIFNSQNYSFYIYSNITTNSIECFCPQLRDFVRPYEVYLLLNPHCDLKQGVSTIKRLKMEIQLEESIARNEIINVAYSIYPLGHQEKNLVLDSDFTHESIFKGSDGYLALPLYDEKGINNIIYFNNISQDQKYNIQGGMKIQPAQAEHHYIGVFPNPIATKSFFNKYPLDEWQIVFVNYNCDVSSFLRLISLMNKRNLPVYLLPGYDQQSLMFCLRFIAIYANYFSNFFCDVSFSSHQAEFTLFYDRKEVKQIQFSNFFTTTAKTYRVDHGILGEEENEYAFARFDFESSNNHMQNGKSSYGIKMALKADNVILFCKIFIRHFGLDGNLGLSLYDQDVKE